MRNTWRLFQNQSWAGQAALLALGLGTAAAVLPIVNALLFKPLPFHEPHRLVALRVAGPSWSPAMLQAFQTTVRSFEETTGVQEREASLGVGDQLRPVRLETVSASYFSLLGVAPAAGRAFRDEEDVRGRPAPVAIVSDSLARAQFADRARALGAMIDVDGRQLTIVGVMPRGFHGVIGRTDVWAPLASARWLAGIDTAPERPSSRWFEVVARLGSDVTLDAAAAAFAAEGQAAIEQLPDWRGMLGRPRYQVTPLRDTRDVRRLTEAALVLLGGSGLLILLVIGSVSTLQLACVMARERELAIRRALGASAARLVATVAARAAVPLAAGLCGAAIVAHALQTALVSLRPPSSSYGLASADPLPIAARAIDGRVAAVLAGLVVLTWLLLLVWPARQALRVGVEGRRDAHTPASGAAWRRRLTPGSALIAAQIALGAVVIVCAGVMIRSALAIAARDRGFDPDRVVAMSLVLPARGFDAASTAPFYERVVSSVSALPGVESAAVASCAPGAGRCRRSSIQRIDGSPPEVHAPTLGVHFATPGFFETMGARIVAGRPFDARDRAGTPPVAIVSHSAARRLWPGQSPIGRRVSMFFADGRFTEDREVVGVAADIEYDAVEDDSPGDIYFPASQAAWSGGKILLRTEGPSAAMLREARAAVRAAHPQVLVADAATLRARLGAALANELFVTRTLAACALVAVLLAAVGITALSRVGVARTRRDLGIRLALGATRGRVCRRVVAPVAVVAAMASLAGLAAAFWTVELLASLTHGVPPRDAFAFTAAPPLLIGIASLAAARPAWVATRTGVVDLLRQ